jgi:hypothetical protein
MSSPKSNKPSSERPILAPVSRNKVKKVVKSKTYIQEDENGDDILTDETPASLKKVKTRSRTGEGLSWWLNDSGDFDEEEESKSWELPWSNVPTYPANVFSVNSASDPVTTPASAIAANTVFDLAAITPPSSVTPTPPKATAAKTKAQQRKDKARSRPKAASRTPVSKPTSFDTTDNQLIPAPNPTNTAKTGLFSLPIEVRDQIYGHLLGAAGPIPVLRSWTQCFGRYRGDLEPAILSVCRQTYEEGIRILYSSNVFLYRIRDGGEPVPETLDPRGYVSPTAFLPPPPAEEQGSGGKRAAKRPKTARKKKTGPTFGKISDCHRVIYLAKYAHLLRHVEIELESNRTEEKYCVAMAEAIRLLGHGKGGVGARLVSLRFSLTPVAETVFKLNVPVQVFKVTNFFADTPINEAQPVVATGSKRKEKEAEPKLTVMEALRDMDRRMLHFTVYTPSSRRLEMTLDMTTAIGENFGEPYGHLLSEDELISQQRHQTMNTAQKAFKNLQFLIQVACTDTDQAVKSGWWTEYGPKEVSEVRSEMDGLTVQEKSNKYRSKWYTGLLVQMREQGEYMRNPCPAYPMCVRGKLALPAKRRAEKEDEEVMDEDEDDV